MRRTLTGMGMALWVVAAAGQSPPVLFQTPMSPRNANYAIEVALDAAKHTLKGHERIRWRNIQAVPAAEAWFHLYLNAFANDQSVFIQESAGQLRGDQFDKKHWGYCRVTSLTQIVEGKPVTLAQAFPGEDRTVMKVALARPVPPGSEAEFEVAFEDQLPKVFARAGFSVDFDMAGQWFPKLGVFQGERGWNCHEYHANSEFFSDFGVYDVTVTVPKDRIVGATGVQWKEESKGDSKVLHFRAEDVHDFAWAASPRFAETVDRWRDVEIRVLMQPLDRGSAARHIRSLKLALDFYANRIWPYPYSQITVVDPPPEGMGAGGMEYPTLITTFDSPLFPRSLRIQEMTTVHEFGHQYWYGMEANNEFEEAWLDEGINSYYEARIMDEAYGSSTSLLDGFLGLSMGDFSQQRLNYMGVPDMDPVVLPSWKYFSNGAYGAMSYAKPALALKTLEGVLGTAEMDRVLRVFFERVRFSHPTTEDFLRIASEAAGRDLTPILKPMLYGTGTVDFKVARVKSVLEEKPEGYDLTADPPKLVEKKKDKAAPADRKKDAKPSRDVTIVVQRKGELVLPVDVLITFKDGTTKVEHWDGEGRYATFRTHGPDVVKVVVDPDGKIPLDLNRLNNGWTKDPDDLPADALQTRFRVSLQGLLAVLTNLL